MTRATSAPPPVVQPLKTHTDDVGTTKALAWVAPSPKVQANRLQRAASCDALRRRVQEIGATLVTRDGKTPASVRLAWLASARRLGLPWGMGSCSGGMLPGTVGLLPPLHELVLALGPA